MPPLNEAAIEKLAIKQLQAQGFTYRHGADIASEGADPLRDSLAVVLPEVLRDAIKQLNPAISDALRDDAWQQVVQINTADVLTANEHAHRLMTEGVSVRYHQEGEERGDLVRLIDFEKIENNNFLVVNQLSVTQDGQRKRADIVLFVNGLPVVLFELKNAIAEQATLRSAYRQLQTYTRTVSALCIYNALLVVSDGVEAKMGALSADFSRFTAWKSIDGESIGVTNAVTQLDTLIKGALNRETLLDVIRHFIVFNTGTNIDPDTKIKSSVTVKKIAAYHQYYAANKAVESVVRAARYQTPDRVAEAPAQYRLASVSKQPPGDKKGGVVWHTQGSGKSLSMLFAVGKLVLCLDNPTILVITDRNDLDNQLFDTFADSWHLIRQRPIQANNRRHIKRVLKREAGGVIFSTIQKFSPADGNVYDMISVRHNVVVIVDEAHRTQYGLHAKTIATKNEAKEVKTVYGFAKYLRDALPNATFLGFTGTPIETTDKFTRGVFGDYVDVYDIAQAVQDGVTTPIYYESRLAKIRLSKKGQELIGEIDQEIGGHDIPGREQPQRKWVKLEAIVGSTNRVKRVATDIVTHFECRTRDLKGKGMIVTMSRRIAAALYTEITALRPTWHSDDVAEGAIKVVMTADSSDAPELEKHHTTKEERHQLATRMKEPNDSLQLVIVCEMWLTGFDVPSLHTIYLDKPIRGHNLMQAIARVNRVYKDKEGGLVVDYLGIASDLKRALSFYADSGGKGDPLLYQEQAADKMIEKLEVVSQMFHHFDYKRYFDADDKQKLTIILDAVDFIMREEGLKTRFINEITALARAFAITSLHPAAIAAREQVAFFQAVKARIVKFTRSTAEADSVATETVVRQIIDEALVSDEVIDVFDAAGIKKRDISVMSHEFLDDMRNMKHKNIALATLKSLLNDEIRCRARTNVTQGKSLMERLEDAIRRYNNGTLTTAEIMEELFDLAQHIKESDAEVAAMNLSDTEYAFYCAVADNGSAVAVMDNEVLKDLARALAESVKQNATIDWEVKESVRAKLRLTVRRLLRTYGYPPDKEQMAIDNVIKQAEVSAHQQQPRRQHNNIYST